MFQIIEKTEFSITEMLAYSQKIIHFQFGAWIKNAMDEKSPFKTGTTSASAKYCYW